jgi:hypothetical protein
VFTTEEFAMHHRELGACADLMVQAERPEKPFVVVTFQYLKVLQLTVTV